MVSEHTPRPGATWRQQPTRREVIVPDGPWGGPAAFTAWGPDGGMPPSPALNRAQRRAAERAARKKGNHR